MFRILFALTAFLQAATLLAQTAPGARLPSAIVYSVTDSAALDHFDENPEVTRQMTDRLLLGLTRQRDVGAAWKTLVRPSDRVGIKLSTAGGPYLSSHRGIIASLIAGLQKSGIPRSQIVLWDRNGADLAAAGYANATSGVSIRSIDPPGGFDSGAKILSPVLGKLIWGDLLFKGKRASFRVDRDADDGLSSESHLPKVLTQHITKIINVATFSDEPGCGVAGALHNVTVANLDNNRRFSDPRGAFSIPEIYGDPRIGPKVILHILDGLVAQYAGGPTFHANYAFAHNTIYASKDPVALDSLALRLMEQWRLEAKLPPIGRRGDWLKEAEILGVGVASEERITLETVPHLP